MTKMVDDCDTAKPAVIQWLAGLISSLFLRFSRRLQRLNRASRLLAKFASVSAQLSPAAMVPVFHGAFAMQRRMLRFGRKPKAAESDGLPHLIRLEEAGSAVREMSLRLSGAW